jgi:hypothetical protein
MRSGRLPKDQPVPGITALTAWREGRYGSVLFYVEADSPFAQFGMPRLYHEDLKRLPLSYWTSIGGGGFGPVDVDERARPSEYGALALLGTGVDSSFRVAVCRANCHVAAVQCKNRTRTWQTPVVGTHGFVLLGCLAAEPTTTLTAVSREGDLIPCSDFTL